MYDVGKMARRLRSLVFLPVLLCIGCGLGDHVHVAMNGDSTANDNPRVTTDDGIARASEGTVAVGHSLTGAGMSFTASGKPNTREWKVEEFKAISAGPIISLHYKSNPKCRVRITAAANVLPHVVVKVEGTELQIMLDGSVQSAGKISAEVQSPQLVGLTLSGSSTGICDGLNEGDLALLLSGDSQALLHGKADTLSTHISGASRASLSHFTAETLEGDVSGGSSFDLAGVAGDTNLDVSGASTVNLADVKANRVLLDLSGASVVRAKGKAGKVDIGCGGASSADLTKLLADKGSVSASGASSIDVNVAGALTQESSGASSIRNAHR